MELKTGSIWAFCHDLALVRDFCDRVLVMERSRLVEEGPVSKVLSHPSHPYTQALVDATLCA